MDIVSQEKILKYIKKERGKRIAIERSTSMEEWKQHFMVLQEAQESRQEEKEEEQMKIIIKYFINQYVVSLKFEFVIIQLQKVSLFFLYVLQI